MKPLPTLRQLRYLVTLSQTLHFGRAAELCLVTQSTLSAGLKELETLLDATLVERTKRRVVLTPLGEEVVERARRLLREAEDLADLARGGGQPLSGPLRLGVIPTIGPYLLPRVLPLLRRRHPALKLYLREDLTARVLDRLAAGDLDLVLLALPWDLGGLEVEELFEDPFFLGCPAGHPLAGAARIESDALAEADLLLLEDGHCLRDHALAACGLPSVRHGAGFQGTSLATLAQMAASGLGATLLPAMAVEAGLAESAGLQVRPLEGSAPARTIGLAWRRSSSRGDEFRMLGQVLKEGWKAGGGGVSSVPP